MSVFKPQGSSLYVYDFQRGGRRFSGPTGKASKREAELVEKREKERAEAEIKLAGSLRSKPMTIDMAAARYWEEVGQHQKRANNVDWSLDWLVKAIGPETRLRDITDDTVARIVAKRRGERVNNVAAKKAGKGVVRFVSPARVNRSVTEPLRKVLLRAKNVWKQPVEEITWRDHLLKEPHERIRELSADEEARLLAALRERHHAVVKFSLRMGFRLSESVNLTWDRIDWGTLSIRVTGKGNKTVPVPMPPGVRDLLWAEKGRHEDRVFTWADGEHLTVSGLTTAVRRALKRAGIVDFRFHDMRHTAATRLLRQTGNLKMTAKLLRHSDLKSTMRYAHVLDDDLRDALAAMDADLGAASPKENHMVGSAGKKVRAKTVG